MAGPHSKRARLKLSDVTVCAADTRTPDLAARALEICVAGGDFADAILYSDTPVAGNFRHVSIDRIASVDDYNRFCLRELAERITTPFVLVVQWDGYIIAPEMWSGVFRKYDYVGAPVYDADGTVWVGNGGFSLRSRKLLDATATLPAQPRIAEDVFICRISRDELEREFNVKFAPVEVAARFSYETKYTGKPTFGFHSAPNFWRHASDAEILDVFGHVPPETIAQYPTHLLIVELVARGRVAAATQLYRRARTEVSVQAIATKMAERAPRPAVANLIAILEGANSPSLLRLFD